MRKSKKVVVITGAAAGVGRAVARAFAEKGAAIGLIGRDRDRLESTKSEVEALGGSALVLVADVANPEQIETAAARVERELGPIDIWVNNAMATVFAPFDAVTPAEFRRATEVTYLGYVYGTMSALKRMKARDRGTIVQVGSALAYRSIPLQSAYCGAKHAIVGFTDSLRSELLHDGSNVRITVVNLPAINTPQFEWSRTRLPGHPQPVPPIYQPELAARCIVWAAEHPRREIDFGFPTILARNAQKLAPGVADAYLARTAYEDQQTAEPVRPDRPDNLFAPVPGDYAARGGFSASASSKSAQLWLNQHRAALALVGGTALTGIALWRWKSRPASGDSRKPRVSAPRIPFAENRTDIVYAWRGPSLLIVDAAGTSQGLDNQGFYFRQARFLKDFGLELFGEKPFLCSVAEIAPHEIELTYVYPEKKGGGSDRGGEKNGVRYGSVDIRLTYTLRPNGLVARLRLANRWTEKVSLDISWRLSADFADYSETFGDPQQQAEVTELREDGGVRFRYEHDQLPFETVVQVGGAGSWTFNNRKLSSRLVLERQSAVEIHLHVAAIDRSNPIDEVAAIRREAALAEWQDNLAFIEAPGNPPIVRIANDSMRDIGAMSLLEGPPDEWLVPAAGVPLFHSFWARDALTTVWQASVFDRAEMADHILTAVGRLQGKADTPSRDEQPGRLIRVLERSPRARLDKSSGLYYGDYASPFAFVFALAQLYAWSGEAGLLKKHFDRASRILDWARERGDIDGDGYLEYKTLSPSGPKHQGWRDAENAVVYEDGSEVNTPIATCEIQGYWFAAQQIMAALSAAAGKLGDASDYWKSAGELKTRFNRDFWMPGEGCVALGLDPQKRQIGAVTSNAGQTLATGIVNREHLPSLVARLFKPDIFSGWGVRTLSRSNPAYNPLGYHLGSVWPVENATLLFGLKRFGFEREVHVLARALYDLALLWRGNRIPECVGGYGRDESAHPGAYSQANAPQAWNQSVFPILVQTLLGILPLGSLNLLTLYPMLPDWLPEITVRNLRVGDATVSLRFRREADGHTHFDVLEKRGTLHILKQPPIESLTAGIWDRLGFLGKDTPGLKVA